MTISPPTDHPRPSPRLAGLRYHGFTMKFALLAGVLMTTSMFAADSVYDFSLKSIDGQDMPLSAYKGKTVLVVNTASQCGFTPQYTGLEAVYNQYKDKGLVLVGVPANNFGGQEPGTNA